MSAAQTTSSDLLYHCTNTVTQIDVVVNLNLQTRHPATSGASNMRPRKYDTVL
ncbi:hypothetical protein HMPREF9056_01794 [Actinomyces sp. oral taxon 170 str. F0386]|nr:hypothetical protein HMPREF9056_01794 [Actinomyces sp. oral taxon 170 str. F0386]